MSTIRDYKSLTPSQLFTLAATSGPQFIVVDNFLGPIQSKLVREACVAMDNAGVLQNSKMGKGTSKWANKKSRGDRLAWLTSMNPTDVPEPVRKCVRALQSVRKDIAKEAPDLGLGKRISIQLACYPGNGTGYVRHTDAFRDHQSNQSTRKITALYYMNPEWEEAHGGHLRAYYDQPERHWDVEPKMDRLLLFRSDIVPHEVLPSHAMRYALTCWMYTSEDPTSVDQGEQKETPHGETTASSIACTAVAASTTGTTTGTTGTTGTTTTTAHSTPLYPITYGLQLLEKSTIAAWGNPHNASSLQCTMHYDALPLPVPPPTPTPTTTNNALIFISIASYRDSECQHTVESLFAASKYPDRLRIGICFQYDATLDQNCFTTMPMVRPHQVQVMHVPSSEAKGPCWARHLTETLYNDEDYVLQLDSHMRMRPNWDVYLIESLSKCPSKKAVLTCYPLGYELPNKIPKKDVDVTILCADHFDKDGMLRIKGKRLVPPSPLSTNIQTPRSSLFWASGFSFSKSLLLQEIPYDPNLSHLFFGEEISMALRMYTHGWDIYTPMDAVVYHLWDRSYRPTVREHFTKAVHMEKTRAQKKIHRMLGMLQNEAVNGSNEVTETEVAQTKEQVDGYGLGTVRSLQEFETYCGVSFCNRKIHERAQRGGQADGAYRDDKETSAAKVMKLLQMKGLLNGF